MVFVTFYGEAKTEPTLKVGKLILIPLIVLGVLSIVGGFVELPKSWGNFHPFSNLLHYVLPPVALHAKGSLEVVFELISAAIVLVGVYLAYVFYIKRRTIVESLEENRLYGFFYRGWDFDRLYDVVLVRPVVWLSEMDKNDFVNWFNVGVSKLALFGNQLLGLTQTGRLRWYLMSFAIGVVVILTYMIYR
jgi:NADH-quinone oxidoreductase subunit L